MSAPNERAVAMCPASTTALNSAIPTEIFQHDPHERNASALIDALSRAGFIVHKLADGFAVCRWAHAKHCPDVAALAAFAKQVGARA